jgi:hypothetical protein
MWDTFAKEEVVKWTYGMKIILLKLQ